MNDPDIHWTSFLKKITIAKPIDEVYTAWATKAGIESWFLEKADYRDDSNNHRNPPDFINKGDAFAWKWHNWDVEERGTILQANGVDLISFTFGSGGNVNVSLISVASGTEVTLQQEDIPTDDKAKKDFYVGCSNGWTFWLTNLKAWMEYGITLNAKGLQQGETANLVNS